MDKDAFGGNSIESGEIVVMSYSHLIDLFFILSWSMVLCSVIALFILLKHFHATNKYFPNLYAKKDRKKIKTIIKSTDLIKEKKIVRLMLWSFYVLNIFILLPIIVEIYLFSK